MTAYSSAAGSTSTNLAGRLALALVVVLAVAAWLGLHWWEKREYALLAERGQVRLTLYGETLHSELDKALNIPLVLSSDSDLVGLLTSPENDYAAERALALSRRLQAQNEALRVSVIYVLDRHGRTLSASNWAEGEGSFVGRSFEFRPYYTAAMELRPGKYFALGSTSHRPGYYISIPVSQDGHAIGAVVVKTSLDDLEHGWSGGGERVFVTDGYGIVFITNTAEWRYRSWGKLGADALRRVAASRQYGDIDPRPLGNADSPPLTRVDGKDYVSVSQTLSDGQNWTLHILMGTGEVRARLRELSLLAVAGTALAGMIAYVLAHRVRIRALHTRELESRVDERTSELRAKQNELIQAAKLAALGQMSAGMVHEVNQPLAAIRSYADNALTLLDRGQEDVARANLGEIIGLTDRMGRITGQLKQFARKSQGTRQAVGLGGTVDAALALLAAQMRRDTVVLDWERPIPDLLVWADDVQLQQVLVNLFRNALDAMRDGTDRRLTLEIAATAQEASLSVRDSGPGIGEEIAARLFDPFFTTKAEGEGLGLGLSISEGIMRSMGGNLTAANHPEGGAIFSLVLRRVEDI